MQRVHGFTLVELVIAIVVGGILTSIALNRFSGVQSRFAVRSARSTFESYHARARARAIERGTSAVFHVDADGDSIWVTQGGDQVVFFDFAEQLEVDLQSSATGVLELCFTPRGYADTDCNSSNLSSTVTVTFVQGAESREVDMWPLGQLKY